MLKDIYFSGENQISMHKKLFSQNEIALANCIGFTYHVNESIIVCDLTVTTRIAIFEFLKETFSRVWNDPSEAFFKEGLVKQINECYNNLYIDFKTNMLPKLGYEDKLYKHQKEVIFWSVNKKFNFIAHEMGLGKTVSALSISKILSIKRTLIICPASLKHNWKGEAIGKITKFNELGITLLDASSARTIKAFQERFVICNFESLDKHMKHILSSPIGHIIIDEAVKIKSTSTINHKMCAKIIEANPDAKVTLMSGFPVRNRITDLFAYLKICHHPLGHNYAAFMREYIVMSNGRFKKVTGSKNQDVLYRQLSNFMLRKKKEDCLDLPMKIYTKIQFSLDDYKAEYDRVVKETLEKSNKSSLNSCVHSINIVTSKAKLKGIIEFIDNLIDQGEKVVCFTGYTEIIEALQNHFADKCVMINGSVNSSERNVRVEMFVNDDNCMVFLGNTIAAGMGLTLTVSSNTVFCDLPFSPADLIQAEDRTHRIGATKPCNYYYATAIGSIDDYLYNLVTEKAHDASKVIDGKSTEMHALGNVSELLVSQLKAQYGIVDEEEVADVET